MPLFVQGVIGTSATQSGTVLAPMMMAMIAMSIGAGQIIGRTARYKWVAMGGLITSALGMYLLSGMGIDTDYATVARNIVLVGLGMGATMPCFNLAAQNAVGLNQIGVVTALIQFLRSIGGTIGAAVLGSTLVSSYGPALRQALPAEVVAALPAASMAQLSNPQALLNPDTADVIRQTFAQGGASLAALFDQVLAGVKVALSVSLHGVFLTCAIILTVAAIGALFLPDRPLRGSFAPDERSADQRNDATPARSTAETVTAGAAR